MPLTHCPTCHSRPHLVGCPNWDLPLIKTFHDFTKRNGEYVDRSFFYRTLMSKLKKFSYMKPFDTVEKRRAIAHRIMADEKYLSTCRGMMAWVVADGAVLDAVAGKWN